MERMLLRKWVRRNIAGATHRRVVVGVLTLLPVLSGAATLSGSINRLVPPDARPCAFFSLSGVAQADPVLPGQPWIAIRQSQNGFKEIYAMLLAAIHSGVPITVATTGVAVAECDGFVGMATVTLAIP
jgi:hypothetical protein